MEGMDGEDQHDAPSDDRQRNLEQARSNVRTGSMDEDDAMIDACKVEHLISSEARARLVCFLQILFSDKPQAREFMSMFNDNVFSCRDGDVEACELCDDVCYSDPSQMVLGEN